MTDNTTDFTITPSDGTANLRASVYALAAAVGVVLVAYGVATETEVAGWLGIVSALINVAVGALAYRNTQAASLPGTRTY